MSPSSPSSGAWPDYVMTAGAGSAVVGGGLRLLAVSGLSSIVGPDARAFGIDFYQLGAAVLLLGLAGLSVQLLRSHLMQSAAAAWLLACLLGAVGAAASSGTLMAMAGAALAGGFICAGVGAFNPGTRAGRPGALPPSAT